LNRSNSRGDRPCMSRSPSRDRPCLNRSDSRGKRSAPRATFVRDVTVPDGVSCYPGISMTKTWSMKNTGLATWPVGVKLIFLSGDLKPERILEVPRAAPGQIVEVSAVIQAPLEPQQYLGNYRLSTADGQKFGSRIWIDLIVVQPVLIEETKPLAPKISEPKLEVEVIEPRPQTQDSQTSVTVAEPNPDAKATEPTEPKPKPEVAKSKPEVAEPKPEVAEPKPDVTEPKQIEPKPEVKTELVSVPPSKYSGQMEILKGMGFTDATLNDYLLNNNNGNVQRVVEWIISHGVQS